MKTARKRDALPHSTRHRSRMIAIRRSADRRAPHPFPAVCPVGTATNQPRLRPMSLDDDPVRDLCSFIDDAPAPVLAAMQVQQRLAAAGFKLLRLTDPSWSLSVGRYVVMQGASLVAFVLRSTRVGRFHLVGAHTDSPNLRLRPNAAFNCQQCRQLAVEVYGGVLYNSWLDRDLGLAGTVHTHDGQAIPVRLHRPIARIPQLAIHLDRQVNDNGVKLNPQTQLNPLWGIAATAHGAHGATGGNSAADDAAAAFRSLVAELAGIPVDRIAGHDLSLYDLQPSALIGPERDLISAPRLDNLASCHAGMTALIASLERDGTPGTVPVLALFDHEEIGSTSRDGADGAFLATVLERLSLAVGQDRGAHLAALAGSLFLSADMAHAVHPNYADKHDARHAPVLGGGPVIKSNANQRYATTAATAARVRGYAASARIGIQEFTARTDLGCGSTIGPICSARLGIATADLGTPMLSMHSARELAAVADHGPYIALLAEHFAA